MVHLVAVFCEIWRPWCMKWLLNFKMAWLVTLSMMNLCSKFELSILELEVADSQMDRKEAVLSDHPLWGEGIVRTQLSTHVYLIHTVDKIMSMRSWLIYVGHVWLIKWLTQVECRVQFCIKIMTIIAIIRVTEALCNCNYVYRATWST